MQPKQIQDMATTAQWISSLKSKGTPEAFALAWISWEGFCNRILALGLHEHGWTLSTSDKAICDIGGYSKRSYRAMFTFAFGKEPSQLGGFAETWRIISKFEPMRNSIIHGGRIASPEKLEAATILISSKVLNPDWVQSIRYTVNGQSKTFSPVYDRPRNIQSTKRSLEELSEILKAKIEENK
jgi:hypothetical protein